MHCVADNTGELGARKGVNLPGSVVDLPAMAPKDRTDLAYGLGHDMDYVAASFVRTAEGVREIRDYAAEVVREKFGPEHPIPLIISKIESQEALDNWDEILNESDAIMVARGDLGVEVTLQTVAMWTLVMPRCVSTQFPPCIRHAPLSITPGAAADRRDLAEKDCRRLQRCGQAGDRRDADAREHAEEPSRHACRGDRLTLP